MRWTNPRPKTKQDRTGKGWVLSLPSYVLSCHTSHLVRLSSSRARKHSLPPAHVKTNHSPSARQRPLFASTLPRLYPYLRPTTLVCPSYHKVILRVPLALTGSAGPHPYCRRRRVILLSCSVAIARLSRSSSTEQNATVLTRFRRQHHQPDTNERRS